MRRALRFLLAALLLAALAGGVVPAGTAGAHGGDNLAIPVIEKLTPEVDGLALSVAFSANYQFLASNETDRDLLILADSGEPFLRIGPEGTFGNFRSPTWYSVNVPEGLQRFPAEAEEGAGVPPDWRLIRRQPSFGWFDHRLHPAERYVQEDLKKSKVPVRMGSWEVPLRYGDQDGKLSGRFEFQPTLGTYRSALRSPASPADGVTVALAPSSTRGGVPAMFVENRSPGPVVVLGQDGEPFVRLNGKAEVNLRSPAWAAMEQARGRLLTTPADAAAEPEWHEVQDTPRWGWAELRAAPPRANPGDDVLSADGPTTVNEWTVPLLIGDRRTEVEGVTEFVPVADAVEAYEEAAAAAAGTDDGDGDGDSDDGGGNGGFVAMLALGFFAVLFGMFAARKGKAARAAAEPQPEAERPPKLGRIKRR